MSDDKAVITDNPSDITLEYLTNLHNADPIVALIASTLPRPPMYDEQSRKSLGVDISSGIDEKLTDKYDEVDEEPESVMKVGFNQRYLQFVNEKLGDGSFKTVYKGFDQEEGIEVAWNEIILSRIPVKMRRRLHEEIQMLRPLDCEYIIKFFNSWEDKNNGTIVFITELMTSGTLRNYIARAKKTITLKVVKKWCRQILQGLLYLHNTMKVIHRDLKCDNIFINGNQGAVKIGDLGFSTELSSKAASVIGTPEFMAPELYDEKYDEKVDIYSFGMCVLEMFTQDYPYSECSNAAQIFKKVTSGIMPLGLSYITNSKVSDFIKLCLVSADKRLSAEQLLLHEFFLDSEEDHKPCLLMVHKTAVDRSRSNSISRPMSPTTIRKSVDIAVVVPPVEIKKQDFVNSNSEKESVGNFESVETNAYNNINRQNYKKDPKHLLITASVESPRSAFSRIGSIPNFSLLGESPTVQPNKLNLRISIKCLGLNLPDKMVNFGYDAVADDPVEVGREMVSALEAEGFPIGHIDADSIADEIRGLLIAYEAQKCSVKDQLQSGDISDDKFDVVRQFSLDVYENGANLKSFDISTVSPFLTSLAPPSQSNEFNISDSGVLIIDDHVFSRTFSNSHALDVPSTITNVPLSVDDVFGYSAAAVDNNRVSSMYLNVTDKVELARALLRSQLQERKDLEEKQKEELKKLYFDLFSNNILNELSSEGSINSSDAEFGVLLSQWDSTDGRRMRDSYYDENKTIAHSGDDNKHDVAVHPSTPFSAAYSSSSSPAEQVVPSFEDYNFEADTEWMHVLANTHLPDNREDCDAVVKGLKHAHYDRKALLEQSSDHSRVKIRSPLAPSPFVKRGSKKPCSAVNESELMMRINDELTKLAPSGHLNKNMGI